MATHCSILAWRSPWREEPGGSTVHRIAKSWTQLKQLNTCTRKHYKLRLTKGYGKKKNLKGKIGHMTAIRVLSKVSICSWDSRWPQTCTRLCVCLELCLCLGNNWEGPKLSILADLECLHKQEVYVRTFRATFFIKSKQAKTHMPFNLGNHKEKLVYPFNGVSHSNKNAWSTGMCYSVNEPWEHNTFTEKSRHKRPHIVWLFIWNVQSRQIHRDRK